MPNFVIYIAIVLCVVGLLAYAYYRFQTRSQTMYTVESTDEVDGERSMLANSVLAVFRYELQNLHVKEVTSTTSPDRQRSYFRVATPNGYVMVQFDWDRGRVHCTHTMHSELGGCTQTLNLRVRHNLVDEVKLGQFADKIEKAESALVKLQVQSSDEYQELIARAMIKAVGEALADSEEEAEEEEGDE